MAVKNNTYDTIVIGAGPGGIQAAKTLGLAGKKVVLVSTDLGGECLNFGCIPTKTYLFTAEILEKLSHAEIFGLEGFTNLSANWGKMKKREEEVVAKLKKQAAFSLQRAGVKIIYGRANLEKQNTITVTPQEAANYKLQATNIILATGSEPIFPPGFEPSDRILTNHEIIDLPALPKTLFIIGGGSVGVEFASLFAALGTKVTIAERAQRLLLAEDEEISAELERVFVRKGIIILKNAEIKPAQTQEFEKTLIATGRKPVFKNLNLDTLNIRYSPRGIETNEFLQTNVPHIFAIGDLAGKALLAYTAEREGEIAANFILGKKLSPINYEVVVNTIFSLPEIASCGLTESEAKKRGLDYTAGKALFSANAKALISNARDGLAKMIVDKTSRKILGVHLIGEKATEIISQASLALSAGLTIDEFSANIQSHPVLGEIFKEVSFGFSDTP